MYDAEQHERRVEEAIMRVPEYLRRYIKRLQRDLEESEAQLAAINEGTGEIILYPYNTERTITFPKKASVKVRFEDRSSIVIHVRDNTLDMIGSDRLYVTPAAANHLQVGTIKYEHTKSS